MHTETHTHTCVRHVCNVCMYIYIYICTLYGHVTLVMSCHFCASKMLQQHHAPIKEGWQNALMSAAAHRATLWWAQRPLRKLRVEERLFESLAVRACTYTHAFVYIYIYRYTCISRPPCRRPQAWIEGL